MSHRHWLASYRGMPAEIDADRHSSVTAMAEEAMRRHANATAFVSAGQSLSFASVDALSRNLCAYLQHAGVRKGDRVAVMLPNIAAFPLAFLAIARAGAVQVNINPMYTAGELAHQLHDAGCKHIVIFSDALPALNAVLPQHPMRTVLVAGRPAFGDALGPDCAGAAGVPLRTALARGATLPCQPVSLCGSDLLFLQYTGGTTGPSKGAALTHRNLIANVEQFKAFMPHAIAPGKEVIVTALPLYHIFALAVNLIGYFSAGAQNWLVADARDIDGLVTTLERARPTVFIGVNTLYAGLVRHPRLATMDWSRLKLAAGGGAAVLRTVSERWQAITGSFIREGYGLSETSPVLSFNPGFIEAFSGTTGLPVPSTDIVLLGDDDQPVHIGEAGEICARGPQVMAGYWNQPETTAAAFTADGYFRTGDIGMFDQQGFLKIVDRKKDMIIVSGFNVYPNEVEDVASACAGVLECACVGAADDKSGEAVLLYVVQAPGGNLTEQDVITHCRTRMAAYKVPKRVQFLPSLPKSNIGKILRRELRK